MIKILVDAMGGDNAPAAIVSGAVQALEKDGELHLIFTGKRSEVEAELCKLKYDKNRVEIVDCPDVIGMNDSPTEAVFRKDSSMMKGFSMLKAEDGICAFVTAGSTGAAIAGGQIVLGRLKTVKRAALCPAIPNSRGAMTLLCDCGANAECKPLMLCQFALLASCYAKAGFGINEPKVGLLNNGAEEHKGDTLRQETYKLLSKMQGINFIGNVEGRDIMLGECDVVVADGFSGNIALKSVEGCGKLVLGVMKKEFSATLRSKIGYLFAKKAIGKMRAQLDFEKSGGALLLGLKKVVVKSHGSSKPETIANAVLNAAAIHRGGMVQKVEKMLESTDLNSLVSEDTQ